MVWEKFLHHILCMVFEKNYFLCYILSIDQMSDYFYLFIILSKMCIAFVFFSVCDVIHFKINFVFYSCKFVYLTNMSRQKFRYLENEERFKIEIKAFFILLKDLILPNIVSDLRVRL